MIACWQQWYNRNVQLKFFLPENSHWHPTDVNAMEPTPEFLLCPMEEEYKILGFSPIKYLATMDCIRSNTGPLCFSLGGC